MKVMYKDLHSYMMDKNEEEAKQRKKTGSSHDE